MMLRDDCRPYGFDRRHNGWPMKHRKEPPFVGKYSQEMLAEMIGTTRSRVSFFMNKFRRLGFIEYNGKLEVHKSLLNMVLQEKPEIKTRDEAPSAE